MNNNNIYTFDGLEYQKNSERALREALLKSIPAGDIQTSALCKLFANSFGFPRSHCVLEIDSAYYAVGRYGWLSPDFNFDRAEQRDLYETTEFLDPRSEIDDFYNWPEQLLDINYLLVSPILIDGKRVGFCGVADTMKRNPADSNLVESTELLSEICANRLMELQKIHLSTQLLLSGISTKKFFS